MPAQIWSMWSRFQALAAVPVMMIGGILALFFPVYWVGILSILLSVVVALLELPLEFCLKTNWPIFVNLYYRAILYVLISLPLFLTAPTTTGALCLFISALFYSFAAINGENWSSTSVSKELSQSERPAILNSTLPAINQKANLIQIVPMSRPGSFNETVQATSFTSASTPALANVESTSPSLEISMSLPDIFTKLLTPILSANSSSADFGTSYLDRTLKKETVRQMTPIHACFDSVYSQRSVYPDIVGKKSPAVLSMQTFNSYLPTTMPPPSSPPPPLPSPKAVYSRPRKDSEDSLLKHLIQQHQQQVFYFNQRTNRHHRFNSSSSKLSPVKSVHSSQPSANSDDIKVIVSGYYLPMSHHVQPHRF